MRNGQLFFSAIQFLMIIALFGLVAVFFIFHYLPKAREEVAEWILHPGYNFFLLGIVSFFIVFSLSFCFWMMQKGTFIRIKMKKGNCMIDEAVIRNTIYQFWKESFPREKVPLEIYCAEQKIEIITGENDQNLEMVEQKLGEFFAKQFGYEREYFITLIRR